MCERHSMESVIYLVRPKDSTGVPREAWWQFIPVSLAYQSIFSSNYSPTFSIECCEIMSFP